MTPPAVTPAARRASSAAQPETKPPPVRSGTRASGGRTVATAKTSGRAGSVHRPSAPRSPRSPRRFSGPVSGLVGGRIITRPQRAGSAAPAPAAAPPQAEPRTARREPRAARSESSESLGARAIAYVRALPDHSLLDRIIRGRAWIPLLGVLLAGIVAMQVEVLKLGASIGRSIERGTALQSRNAILRANVAELSDEARIEQMAAGMGMTMPAPSEVKFVIASGGADVQRAISNVHAPDSTAFTARLQAAALAAGLTTSGASVTGTPGTTPPTTPPATPSTGGVPVQTGAAATPVGAAAPTSGQTGPSGGTVTPTQG